jgi:lysophospholipase L1-like esterase
MSSSRATSCRWIGRLALATLVPLLVAETALQLGHLAISSRAGRGPVDASAPALLCLGDSFTFGLGAEKPDGPWPAQMAQRLAADPIDGRSVVVNGGWPAQHSRILLEDLARRFARGERPARVAVLAGINDQWSRPAEMTAAEVASIGVEGGGDGATSVAGGGGDGPATFELRTLLFASPETDTALAKWDAPAAGIPVAKASTAEVAGAGVGAAANAPSAKAEKESKPKAIERMLKRSRALFDANDAAGALAEASAAVELDGSHAGARQERVRVALRLQRRDLVDADLAWFDGRLAAGANANLQGMAASAHLMAGNIARAGEIARKAVEDAPSDAALWNTLAQVADRERRPADAIAAVGKSLELGAAKDDAATRCRKLRWRAQLRVDGGDTLGALGDLVEAWQLDRDDDRLVQGLLRKGTPYDAACVAAVAAAAALGDERRRQLEGLITTARDPDRDAFTRTLAHHLERMGELCKAHGAELLVLSYPFSNAAIEAAQKRGAAAGGARFVNVRERFDALRGKHKREELFIRDGHCTDLGYSFMAEAAEAALR